MSLTYVSELVVNWSEASTVDIMIILVLVIHYDNLSRSHLDKMTMRMTRDLRDHSQYHNMCGDQGVKRSWSTHI
jgi:hypothetical protein